MTGLSLKNICLDFPINVNQRSFKKELLKFKDRFVSNAQTHSIKFLRALDNVNLEVNTGDRIGIIGSNGAGKTSLLKVIAGIYEPTAGSFSVNGEITSLLSISGGTHPDLTGYENIVSQLLMRGFRKKQISSLIKEIAEFSELGEFLHLPMKTYSAGMGMRLFFAVATAAEPDILLMDEWISAGDRSFVQKAKEKIQGMVDQSRIVVFSSHDLDLIEKTCNKTILMESGRISYFGETSEIIHTYKSRQV